MDLYGFDLHNSINLKIHGRAYTYVIYMINSSLEIWTLKEKNSEGDIKGGFLYSKLTLT